MDPLPDDLVTPPRAATVLSCNPATVYRLIHRGRLRAWRRGGTRYLVSLADARALLVPVARPAPEVKAEGKRAREARDAHTAKVLARFGLG